MTVLQIDPCKNPLWDRLVQRQHSSLFHSPLWIKALQSTYGFETSAIVVLDKSGEPIAGVPCCKINDFLGKGSFRFHFQIIVTRWLKTS